VGIAQVLFVHFFLVFILVSFVLKSRRESEALTAEGVILPQGGQIKCYTGKTKRMAPSHCRKVDEETWA